MPSMMKKTAALLLLAAMLGCVSCGAPTVGADTTDAVTTESKPDDTTTAPPEDTTEPAETDETTADTGEDTTAETEPPLPKEPEFINPLTGFSADQDLSGRRPAAIMINNIKIATPQEGISYAEVMYECIVEGAQTRLMMLVMEYEELPVVGSVRSSREYYLDFAANHDALYIHAGGSNQAYLEIKQRDVDNLDGVNMYIPDMFYRDSWRRQNMGIEHSLMTTGPKIAAGIAFKKYRTEITPDFDSPLDFVPWGTTRLPEGGEGSYLQVTYSNSHKPYFEYSENEGVYYRWQFLGDKHMDNTPGVQISFDNILLLYLPTKRTGDSKNHMDVTTTGSGEGYYFWGGRYEPITWKKATEDSPLKLYGADGEELQINRGRTFFQICTTSMKESTVIR